MTIASDKDRLSQVKKIALLMQESKLTDMVTVYLSDDDEYHHYGIYSALIPSTNIQKILSHPTWDFSCGDGLPGTVKYHQGEESRVEYLRYGVDDGIEPLVIMREFYEIRESYIEISEEFRLFHNLYHDKKTDQYIKIDNHGNEQLVIIVKPNSVEIRLKEIRQFIAIKDMHLSIQFDCRETSNYSLDELGLSEDIREEKITDLSCWTHGYGDFGGLSELRAFSRLLGKRLIAPLPKNKSGMWGYSEEQEKKYMEFIIGGDDLGDERLHTSNPGALANYFGANPEAPHYLTSVQFRKQVLDKYYLQPSKYSVDDSILRCGSLWSVQIDNHHEDKVCAWLGDLGRDLPYEEQLHWRAHNVIPDSGVSETYFRRQILAQPTDSTRPEHLFNRRYNGLRKICEDNLGWQLLLPLAPSDQHHLQCLRIPATDEQRDFDELILALSKILIDSINEKFISKLIPEELSIGLKGSIAKLEAALTACNVKDAAGHIAFLRKLQNLRSSSSAHRKGSNYQKIASEFDIDSKSLRSVFEGILNQSRLFLEFLITVIEKKFISTPEK